jgi:7-carboxy-7-deazaguanine synthase
MSYAVKEIFYTLQGEGANAGRPAVFCRFSGCNLWSGVERDRVTARCRFCDTDFVGTNGVRGARYGVADLVDTVRRCWTSSMPSASPMVVCTGGEPALQIDDELVLALHDAGFIVTVETNGSLDLPQKVDWVTMSPKAGVPLRVLSGNELKVVWPQPDMDLEALEALDFDLRYLQPLHGDALQENTRQCVEMCLRRPVWRLSLQTHKILGIP